MSDWAEETRDEVTSVLCEMVSHNETLVRLIKHTVLDGIRTALAKAAEAAMEHACDCLSADGWTAETERHAEWCCGVRARDAIRKLGVLDVPG